MTQETLNYLKSEPRFRERKSKWRGIADLIKIKYNLDIDRRLLADILADGSSADRAWRDILKNNEDLRGSDYLTDKDRLEQEKMLQLGYDPNHARDVKLLANL
jgi:hypothetical protein